MKVYIRGRELPLIPSNGYSFDISQASPANAVLTVRNEAGDRVLIIPYKRIDAIVIETGAKG